jgi:NAD+--asparagine ADP-ribosyltransferase
LEKDPKELEKLLNEIKEKQKEQKDEKEVKWKNTKTTNTIHCQHKELMSDSDENNLTENENSKDDNGVEIKILTDYSSASCSIDEI